MINTIARDGGKSHKVSAAGVVKCLTAIDVHLFKVCTNVW